jgi:hypothetical protein
MRRHHRTTCHKHKLTAPHSNPVDGVAERSSSWSLIRPSLRRMFLSDCTSEQDSASGVHSRPSFLRTPIGMPSGGIRGRSASTAGMVRVRQRVFWVHCGQRTPAGPSTSGISTPELTHAVLGERFVTAVSPRARRYDFATLGRNPGNAHRLSCARSGLATSAATRQARPMTSEPKILGRRSSLALSTRFVPDSLLEGDGFEPSVPHKKTTRFGCPRSVAQFAFRTKTGSLVPGSMVRIPVPFKAVIGWSAL